MTPTLVFDIKRYSINDGPGIRITIFFKGCPLRCIWCHNPEGISAFRQKMYARARCIGCQSCVKACPQSAITPSPEGMSTAATLCKHCGLCQRSCPSKAMEITGSEFNVEYLIGEIQKETIFIDRSGGGVTACGGEPLMHPDALSLLLERVGDLGLHRAVDTTLYASPATLDRITPLTDLFLVDLKHIDSDKHLRYCGVPNEPILANIRRLASSTVPFTIRIPLIEGVNADDDNLNRSAQFLASLPSKPQTIQLLPYHHTAPAKHAKLGTRYNPDEIPMAKPSPETLAKAQNIFQRFQLTVDN